MHSEPTPTAAGPHDVIAAWLLCLAVAALAAASPTIAAAPNGLAATARAAFGALRHPDATMLCAGAAFAQAVPGWS